MEVTIKRVSRLSFSSFVDIDGTTFFAPPNLPKIEYADDDQNYQVTDTDRLDLLSDRFYGTPELWWVIAKANSIRLVPRDLVVGSTLTIPSRTRVMTKILVKRP